MALMGIPLYLVIVVQVVGLNFRTAEDVSEQQINKRIFENLIKSRLWKGSLKKKGQA